MSGYPLTLAAPPANVCPARAKSRAGCESPKDYGDKSPVKCLAAFFMFVRVLFMASRTGSRKARRFRSPGLSHPFGSPPRVRAGSDSFTESGLRTVKTNAPHALTVGTVAIRQHNGLYALNDLHKAAGGEEKHRPGYFLDLEKTKELANEISKAGIPALNTVKGGKAPGTFASRELVIAYAAWISPAFHLKVIRVFLDSIAPANTPPALPAPDLASDWQAAPGSPSLPGAIQASVHARASALLLEAYPLVCQHLENRARHAMQAEAGQEAAHAAAQDTLQSITLGTALAERFHAELRTIENLATVYLDNAQTAIHRLRKQLANAGRVQA